MAQAQKQVHIIEPLERFVNRINLIGCYARVSSDSEDQLNSYNNQVDFYESYVNSLENSKLVKIYTDEGITGTRMDKRDGFLQMIEDCRKGLINTIITKSISRFARNITETLSVVRELKSIGVSVYFMTEKIDTAKMGSNLKVSDKYLKTSPNKVDYINTYKDIAVTGIIVNNFPFVMMIVMAMAAFVAIVAVKSRRRMNER